MTVFNQTYNFNQGNMNFGQAMLYGAFGSLTNMMGIGGGCFGGGYGMGMGGSLFSMMGGFGNYGMGGVGCCGGFGSYSDSYYSTMAGMSAANILIGGIFSAISSHKTKVSNEDKMKELETSAKTNLKTLGLTSLKSFNSNNTVEDYGSSTTNAYGKACSTYKESEKIYNTSKGLFDKAESALRGAGLSDKAAPTTSDTKYTNIRAEYLKTHPNDTNGADEAVNKQFSIDDGLWQEYKNAKADADKKKTAMDKAETAMETAKSNAQSAIEALKPLKEEYDELATVEQEKQQKIEQKQQAKKEKEATKTRQESIKKHFNEALDQYKQTPSNETLSAVKTVISSITNNEDIELKTELNKKLSKALSKKKSIELGND